MKKRTQKSQRKNVDLQKRLAAYTKAAGVVGAVGAAGTAALILAPGAEAAVVYTDFNNLTVSNPTYQNGNPGVFGTISMDGFNIQFEAQNNQYGPWTYISNYPAGVMPVTVNTYDVKALSAGDPIGSAGPFYTQTYSGASSLTPNFAGQGDKFLGLEFVTGSVTNFGWVRLNVNAASDTIIIRDGAYQTANGVSILADEGYPIPEPSVLGLMALGVVGLLAYRKSRRAA